MNAKKSVREDVDNVKLAQSSPKISHPASMAYKVRKLSVRRRKNAFHWKGKKEKKRRKNRKRDVKNAKKNLTVHWKGKKEKKRRKKRKKYVKNA